jgi:hypothetical protein
LYQTLSALVGKIRRTIASRQRSIAGSLSLRAYTGDPAVQTDSPTAWADRENWPDRMKRRIEDFDLEAVMTLVQEAALCAPRKYFSDAAWRIYAARPNAAPESVSRLWQSRVNLFRDVEAALEWQRG